MCPISVVRSFVPSPEENRLQRSLLGPAGQPSPPPPASTITWPRNKLVPLSIRPPRPPRCLRLPCRMRLRSYSRLRPRAVRAACGSPLVQSFTGGCVQQGDCVCSSNYPGEACTATSVPEGQYGNSEECEVTFARPVTLSVHLFETESCCDKVSVNGEDYKGMVGPDGVDTSSLSFSSDLSVVNAGFKICFVEAPPSPPPPVPPPSPPPSPLPRSHRRLRREHRRDSCRQPARACSTATACVRPTTLKRRAPPPAPQHPRIANTAPTSSATSHFSALWCCKFISLAPNRVATG